MSFAKKNLRKIIHIVGYAFIDLRVRQVHKVMKNTHEKLF